MFAPALYIQDIWSRENIKILKFSHKNREDLWVQKQKQLFIERFAVRKNVILNICLSWLVEHTDSFYRYTYILSRNRKKSQTGNLIYTYFAQKCSYREPKRYKHKKIFIESVYLGITLLFWLRIFSQIGSSPFIIILAGRQLLSK
jgi:hypothetical protein